MICNPTSLRPAKRVKPFWISLPGFPEQEERANLEELIGPGAEATSERKLVHGELTGLAQLFAQQLMCLKVEVIGAATMTHETTGCSSDTSSSHA